MNRTRNQAAAGVFDRRHFCTVTGATVLAALAGKGADAEVCHAGESTAGVTMQTGNGQWTYQVVSGWGQLPAGTAFGGTHGGIATDKSGHIYVSTQSETGILVYGPDGHLLKTIASEYPEVHSMFYAEEDGVEYLYTTVQKGTPRESWLFVKMKTDGTVVQKITARRRAVLKRQTSGG